MEIEPMTFKTTASCIAELATAAVPTNLVRVWIDDGQEGGWFVNVTPERAKKIEDDSVAYLLGEI
tara:strand:- start:501 stop:695 length:195 start_codon:yes stop_codon:yes gene_type:complete